MTDHTAIPVSPVTESEMEQVKTIFERMAASVVAASGALESLQALRDTVEGMKRDLETQRNQNTWLDEQLSTVRRERDEAIRESEHTKQLLLNARDELSKVSQSTTGNIEYTHTLEESVKSLKDERDDAQFKNMELTDERDTLKKQLKAIQDLVCSAPMETNDTYRY